MKKLLIAALLCVSCFASAADDFSFVFPSVRISELARVVLTDVAKMNYIFDSAFIVDAQEVGLDLRGLSKDRSLALLGELLEAHGYTVTNEKGLFRVNKTGPVPDDSEIFFYRLRYRPVSYVSDLIGSLFPKGRFTFQRASPAPAPAAPVGAAGSVPVAYGSPAASGQTQSGVTGSAASLSEQDAFIYKGSVSDIARLQKLLAVVDVPSGEIVVKAVVYEVTVSNQDGSAFALAASVLGGRLGVAIGGAVLSNAVTARLGGIEAVFSALATDKRFKIVSAPSVRVKSGASARFSVGNETPTLGSVTFQQGGNAVRSVDYRSSGVILDLKPSIRETGIDLTVFQQVSSFAPTTTGLNDSPTLQKREITTTISVKPGELVLLAGLDDSRTSADHSGLSFLPAWLHSSGQSNEKTEVLLVLDVQRL